MTIKIKAFGKFKNITLGRFKNIVVKMNKEVMKK